MDKIGYYPGCSGAGTSIDYDKSTRLIAKHLDIHFEELKDWSCCGSTPAHTVDHYLAAALGGRNLAISADMDLNTVSTPCPSCLASLKTAAYKLGNNKHKKKVEILMGRSLKNEVKVKSVLQILVEDIGLDAIKAKSVKPLKGLKIACYYGCIMNRPPNLMQFDSCENPMAMDNILKACGADVVNFPLKVECCGASMAIPKNGILTKLSSKLLDVAKNLELDAIAVACPLCQMNLDLRQGQVENYANDSFNIPIFYFTQLMGIAFGIDEKDLLLNKLVVDYKPCLNKIKEKQEEVASNDKKEKNVEKAVS